MGREACRAISAAPDLVLASAVDTTDPHTTDGVAWSPRIDELDPGTVDTIVDLSVAEAARHTLAWVVANGKDAVVGTSGLTHADIDAVREANASRGSRILVVPNFSIGAALVQRFAAEAAPYFDSVEVIELHHDAKRDAPSGTSIATAGAIAEARHATGMGEPTDPTQTQTIEGARGAVGPGGVRLHSIRLPGLLAHQEVLFGGSGEGLTLRHDTYDRASFMGGLLLCLRGIGTVDGVAIGLDTVLPR